MTTSDTHEEMAIMKNVRFGMGDRGEPVMSFTAVQEGSAALQIIPWSKAGELIQEAGIGDVKSFEGMPCIVTMNNGTGMSRTMIFARIVKL